MSAEQNLKFPLLISELVSIALALGAANVHGWSDQEEQIASRPKESSPELTESFRKLVQMGEDPFGDAYCSILSPDLRRPLGITYTPYALVDAMIAWAKRQLEPDRGSCRLCGTC